MGAYVIKKSATVWWPVKWKEPGDGGTVVENTIEMRFRRVTTSEFAELQQLGTSPVTAGDDVHAGNLAFIRQIASDWRGIEDEPGKNAAFSDENLREMLEIEGWAVAVGAAFARCHYATPEIREGNSAASLAGGQGAGQPTADTTISAAP